MEIMEKIFDVLVVGELNVDLILDKIDAFPEIGKEIISERMTITLGSSSAIFASNLSTLGAKVRFVGKVGQDSFGDNVIASLQSRGVNTEYIFRSSGHATGATVVLNYGEDRAMITYPGAMKHLTVYDIPDVAFTTCRHLHLSSIFLQPGIGSDLIALFKKAKSLGLTTSIDPQWDPLERWEIALYELLPYVDVFMPNIKELCALTKTTNFPDALNALKPHGNIIVVKNGSEGAFLWDGHLLTHQKPFLNKKVADSIGAGDSFNSGFLYKYLRKEALTDCLEFGALTGAVNTTRSGGTGAFENLDLVKSIAKSAFNYTLT
jgi:sugar/nucleoside kinase (ribokinase family)